MTHTAPTAEEYAALTRLLKLASNDTSQSRVAAGFLLAWSVREQAPPFDLQSLWEMERHRLDDVLLAMTYLVRAGHGLEGLGLETEIARIRKIWGPDRTD